MAQRSRLRLDPWNVHISKVRPAALPPLEELTAPPLRPSPDPHPDLPFENLAFEGGGTKGIAYCGALQVLEERGLYPHHIRRVAGTSSGSFLAAMLAVGCTATELTELLFDTDLASVMKDARFGAFSGVLNMFTVYGFNPGSRLLTFLGDRLRERTGSADVTFEQILQRCGRELCVPVTNISRGCTEYCHAKTTPDMPVRLAVGMSMSLPVLMVPYRVVRHVGDPGFDEEDLYTDGGLLCNYPLHAFDGWWLSMRPEDTFLQQLRPLSKAADRMHDRVRFAPRNPRTLGFTVFDQVDIDVTERWITAEAAPPPRPDTALARSRAARERQEQDEARMYEELEGAFGRLVDALAEVETDGDGRVSRSECAHLFASGTLTPEDAHTLFGSSEVSSIFDQLDHNGDGQIEYEELLRFMDSRNIRLTAHRSGQRSESTSVTNFMGNVFSTMLNHIRRLTLLPEDRTRTVPINTDYVGTADFTLEREDREFLLETGRRATRAFLDRSQVP